MHMVPPKWTQSSLTPQNKKCFPAGPSAHVRSVVDLSGTYRFARMSDSAEQAVSMTLTLTQVGTQIRGKLRAIFSSAGQDQLYYTEEFDVRGEWKEGPVVLSMPQGSLTVEPCAEGLAVTREQKEIWKRIGLR